jgi:hypothetical protein
MSKAISSLPVGAKVKDTGTTYYGSPIIWQVADKNHSGYPANSVTLIAANILKIAAFDAKESGNSDSNRRSQPQKPRQQPLRPFQHPAMAE